jgi:hypothetical protein
MAASPGASQTVTVGATVDLDGTDAAAHSYCWAMTSMPDNCRCTLLDDRTATPSFVADTVGDYVITLATDAGIFNSVGISVVPA